MNKFAILDIGTNSIKFFLFAIENMKVTTILDTSNIARLGEGVSKTGLISKEAMQRNIEVLAEFMKMAEDENVNEIIALGTMCLRVAQNSELFLKKVKAKLGLDIQIISGSEEARLSYLSVLSFMKQTSGKVVVFDTGGGSTEFIFGNGVSYENRISVNLGAVYPTEEFLLSDPVTDSELQKMQDHLKRIFLDRISGQKADYLIGIGGTVTTMGAVMHKMIKYDPKIIHGSEMNLGEVNKQMNLYRNKTIEERKQIMGLHPKRADVILAGAGIIKMIMEIFEADSLIISDRGLRHGLMYDRYLKTHR